MVVGALYSFSGSEPVEPRLRCGRRHSGAPAHWHLQLSPLPTLLGSENENEREGGVEVGLWRPRSLEEAQLVVSSAKGDTVWLMLRG